MRVVRTAADSVDHELLPRVRVRVRVSNLGFRNFSICEIRLEISRNRNFAEISAKLNRVVKLDYLC